MKKWLCIICGWIYDEAKGWPADGIAPGTKWEDVPDDWVCPDCLVTKADFEMIEISDDDELPLVAAVSKQEILPIVIIGSGHAGYQLASALREQSKDVKITVFTEDDGALYSKPALSNALAQGKSSTDLIRETALSWESRLNIRVYPRTKVEKIDRENKKIHTNIGDYHYGRLVLATGATPIAIPIEGDCSAILSVNDLADYAEFRKQLLNKKHITILGDGLIGCEFANDLSAKGYQVAVVGLGDWAMQRLIPQDLSLALQDALQALGVRWYLKNSIRSIQAHNANYLLELSDGQQLETDLILSAVGLKPNTELAIGAGLAVGRGIKTGLNHCSNDPYIYALGDCAEIDGHWMPYINPINQALPSLVSSLLGQPKATNLQHTPVLVKTPIMPLSVLSPLIEGSWHVEQKENGWAASFYDSNGKMKGFALLGHNLQSERNQWLDKLQ